MGDGMGIVGKLTILQEPYLHVLIADENRKGSIVQQIQKNKKNGVIFKEVDGKRCASIDGLFQEFADQLQFCVWQV